MNLFWKSLLMFFVIRQSLLFVVIVILVFYIGSSWSLSCIMCFYNRQYLVNQHEHCPSDDIAVQRNRFPVLECPREANNSCMMETTFARINSNLTGESEWVLESVKRGCSAVLPDSHQHCTTKIHSRKDACIEPDYLTPYEIHDSCHCRADVCNYGGFSYSRFEEFLDVERTFHSSALKTVANSVCLGFLQLIVVVLAI